MAVCTTWPLRSGAATRGQKDAGWQCALVAYELARCRSWAWMVSASWRAPSCTPLAGRPEQITARVAEWIRRLPPKEEIAGSSPASSIYVFGTTALRAEMLLRR